MIKLLYILFVSFFAVFMFSSCEDKEEYKGYKDVELEYFDGTWQMYLNNSNEGTITFNRDGDYFSMSSNRGEVVFGTYDLGLDKKSLVISYAEDAEGNDLMEDYYDIGWSCIFEVIDDNTVIIGHLPFYMNDKLKLIKKK